jgi:antitoxin VapB
MAQEQATAKLFLNGRSQAVRLPKAFRLPGKEVRIRREGNAVILEPIERHGWPRGYWKRIERLRARLGRELDALERPPDALPSPVPELEDG